MAISKLKLSGSTDGKGILLPTVATPGTLIHTAHATSLDEIWIYAANFDSVDRELTIEFGEAAQNIIVGVPNQEGLIQVIPGFILTNSLIVRAYADVTNKVYIFGWVHRVS